MPAAGTINQSLELLMRVTHVAERTSLPLCAQIKKSLLNDRKESLIIANQPKVHPSPLFNSALLITKVTHLRIQTRIASGQFSILFPLLRNRLLQRPDLRKAALPNPQAHLQKENENNHESPEQLH